MCTWDARVLHIHVYVLIIHNLYEVYMNLFNWALQTEVSLSVSKTYGHLFIVVYMLFNEFSLCPLMYFIPSFICLSPRLVYRTLSLSYTCFFSVVLRNGFGSDFVCSWSFPSFHFNMTLRKHAYAIYRDFLSCNKRKIFSRKMLIFFLFLLKT